MLRFLNVAAILIIIGSAVYAYSVKYQTILFSEQIVKMKHELAREEEDISALRAEYSSLTRPDRLQALADKHLDLRPLALNQIVKAIDLPDRAARVDAIGRKLESLGLAEPTATPHGAADAAVTTPGRR